MNRILMLAILVGATFSAYAQVKVNDANNISISHSGGNLDLFGTINLKNLGTGALTDSVLTVMPDGRLRMIPRSQLLAGLTSGNFIQNQNAVAQDADIWIDGLIKADRLHIKQSDATAIVMESNTANVWFQQANSGSSSNYFQGIANNEYFFQAYQGLNIMKFQIGVETTPVLSILSGKIGINNSSPTQALDVNGKALVSVAPTDPTGVVRKQDLDDALAGVDVSGKANINGSNATGTWSIHTAGNAATATELQTGRTLWGQSFNGSANISGNMTGVGSIAASGDITLANTSGDRKLIFSSNIGTAAMGVNWATGSMSLTGVGGITLNTNAQPLVVSHDINAGGIISGASFTGAGTGLTGMASGLSIGGNAATATSATMWNGQPFINTDATTAQYFMAYDVSGWKPMPVGNAKSVLGITGGPFLPLTAGSSNPLIASLYLSDASVLIRNAANSITIGGIARSGNWEGNASADLALFAETGNSLKFYTNGSATTRYSIDASGNNTWTGSGTFQSNNGLVIGANARILIRQTVGGDAEIGAAAGGKLFLLSNGVEYANLSTTGFSTTLPFFGGSAKLGTWSFNSDYARFGHSSYDVSSNYGFLQRSNGDVYISGASINTGAVPINLNGALTGTSATFTGGITLNGAVTIGSGTGMLKLNAGTMQVAVAGTDYVAPSVLADYLPLAAGSANPLTGQLNIQNSSQVGWIHQATSAGSPLYEEWRTSAGTRRGFFGFGSSGNNHLYLYNEHSDGGVYLAANNTVGYELTPALNHDLKSGTVTIGNYIYGPSGKRFALTSVANYNYLYSGGSGGLRINNQADNATLMIVSDGGDVTVAGDVITNSDARLKKDISSMNNVSPLLRNVSAVSYRLRADNSAHLGFIAQDIQKQFPLLVKEGTDEQKTLSINYQAMTAPLLKGWQEHDSRIERLEQRIRELENQLQQSKK